MGGHVVFRADASAAIGTGHVMRSRTLALALIAEGWRATFASRDLPATLATSITASGIGTIALGPRARGVDELAAIEAALDDRPTLVVADHYGVDAAWLHRARRTSDHVMAIDDLADREQPVDLLLNQNLGVELAAYADLVPAAVRLLLGPRYALVRPAFAEARARRSTPRDGRIGRVGVLLGGADAADVTSRAVDGILDLPVAIDVVVGGAYPHVAALQRRLAARRDTRLHVDIEDVAGVMSETDLVIGAPGSASWERCTLGLPTVLVVLADNQIRVAQALTDAGAAVSAGWHADVTAVSIGRFVTDLMADPTRVARMSEAAAALTDGYGTERVVDVIEDLVAGRGEP